MAERDAAKMIAAALREIDLSGGAGGSLTSSNRGMTFGSGGRAMAEVPLGEFRLGVGADGYYANVPTPEGRETFAGLGLAPIELSRRKENREEQLTVDPETGDVMINVGWPDVERGGRRPSGPLHELHNVPRIK